MGPPSRRAPCSGSSSEMARALLLLALVLPACTLKQLPPSERLRRSKCGACHIAPAPASFARTKLEAVLDEHKGRVPLTGAERATLITRLVKPQ